MSSSSPAPIQATPIPPSSPLHPIQNTAAVQTQHTLAPPSPVSAHPISPIPTQLTTAKIVPPHSVPLTKPPTTSTATPFTPSRPNPPVYQTLVQQHASPRSITGVSPSPPQQSPNYPFPPTQTPSPHQKTHIVSGLLSDLHKQQKGTHKRKSEESPSKASNRTRKKHQKLPAVPMTVSEEQHLYHRLQLLDNDSPAVNRLRRKLQLREDKRKLKLAPFDVDARVRQMLNSTQKQQQQLSLYYPKDSLSKYAHPAKDHPSPTPTTPTVTALATTTTPTPTATTPLTTAIPPNPSPTRQQITAASTPATPQTNVIEQPTKLMQPPPLSLSTSIGTPSSAPSPMPTLISHQSHTIPSGATTPPMPTLMLSPVPSSTPFANAVQPNIAPTSAPSTANPATTLLPTISTDNSSISVASPSTTTSQSTPMSSTTSSTPTANPTPANTTKLSSPTLPTTTAASYPTTNSTLISNNHPAPPLASPTASQSNGALMHPSPTDSSIPPTTSPTFDAFDSEPISIPDSPLPPDMDEIILIPDSPPTSTYKYTPLPPVVISVPSPTSTPPEKASSTQHTTTAAAIAATNKQIVEQEPQPSFRAMLLGDSGASSNTNHSHIRVSPYTRRTLKDYIWRDYDTVPVRVTLHEELLLRTHKHDKSYVLPPRAPIDYVYLRPSLVPQVNAFLCSHFWPGIDVRECLEYPDYTVCVLYKHLLIGCGFMTPEAYIIYIAVHHEWRNLGIAKFMIYHLIQTCQGRDITLHVSATNQAMILYQKFGFKPEEFIADFYDKYYPDDSVECKHAFLLRLRR